MIPIRTVLCPVDFSERTAEQVDVAADLARAFGGRLVLHHNVVDVAIGAGVKWMWNVRETSHGDPGARLRQLIAEVSGVSAEGLITSGPVADAIVGTADAVSADLIVLRTRGGPAEDEDAVTARVLERAVRPILALQPVSDEHRMPRFTAAASGRQPLLVPTDLTPSSAAAVELALDLSRRFAFQVHLLSVLSGHVSETAIDDTRIQMLAMLPRDVPEPPVLHVEAGHAAAVISEVADRLPASCIVMGEHVRNPRRDWLRVRPDTPHGVLQRARCPIWYVPDSAAASARSGLLVDEVRDTAFHYWPSSYLYGVVDSREKAESALQRLVETGAPRTSLRTWHGEGSDDALDPNGERHGRGSRLWRTLEKLTGEHDLFEDYADELRHGHIVIGVRCSSDGKAMAAEILRQHGGHRMAYLSLGSVERFGA
jgi:nucleotide-binding universal stress UspA family protein